MNLQAGRRVGIGGGLRGGQPMPSAVTPMGAGGTRVAALMRKTNNAAATMGSTLGNGHW
jgi:hypothetical protein